MEACLIVTYRCNAKCYMCNTWQHPTTKSQEFTPSLVDKLPGELAFINITGGEPFLRNDIEQVIQIAITKAKRIVISTNGYFTDRIIKEPAGCALHRGLFRSLEIDGFRGFLEPDTDQFKLESVHFT